MIRIAIDLELHSDGEKTGKIIQLGYSIFSTNTKQILYTGGDYIKTNQPLHPFITNLTGISEKEISERGISLEKAYNKMLSKLELYQTLNKDQEATFAQIVEWGQGDVKQLREELGEIPNWVFGRSTLNLKAVYQMYADATQRNRRGGLGASLKKLGMEFEPYQDQVAPGKFRQRGSHDARADALNTAKIYLAIISKMVQ